ncbi:hypothetical protein BC834DRAFT_638992 [Gloeopeniophorella convolvens]|nr:hypothetical protein BC834DRAFT_638992 [Gloeopeniophorella convolvens]
MRPASASMSALPRPTRELLTTHGDCSNHVDLSMEDLCRKVERQLGIPGAEVSFLKDDPAEIEATVALVASVFCEREPLTLHLMRRNPILTHKAWTSFANSVARPSALAGFTPVLKVGGAIVSVVLMAPYELPPPPSEAPAGLEPMYDVLYKLGLQYSAYAARQNSTPKLLEWVIAAVDERFQGHRALSLLPQLAMKKAELAGFTGALGKTISHSQDILDKLNFETVGEVSYLTHKYDGVRYFADVGPHDVKQAKLQVIDMATFWKAQRDIDIAQRGGSKL